MTNRERRTELAKARREAVRFAEKANLIYENTGEDGPEVNIANMWANLANALKVGDPTGPDTDPVTG